ncbi:hypothetical protein KC343_g8230, partial [Hortaea werneckii]
MSIAFAIAKHLYPLPECPPKRTKELKVIALGLPRSGTESLHKALLELGYLRVSHGFDWHFNNIQSSPLYYELALLRSQNRLPDRETLRTKYFDRILADYEATTDIPTVWFAEELLLAYPDAKVVLNRRQDVTAWKRSFEGSVLPMMRSWSYWFYSWFQAETYWVVALTLWLHGKMLFRNDFEREAERAYVEHYERLEEVLRSEQREFLRWGVEDGWEPLCKFIGKPVPNTPFPNGNIASEFGPKLMTVDEERFRRARRNAVKVGAVFAAVVGVG